MSTDAVIVDAVRTPIGKRGGALLGLRPAELLRHVLVTLLGRTSTPPSAVDMVVGGCVTQFGEQGLNIARGAWLSTGLDYEVPCITVDASCGSSQQANHLIAAQIESGAIEIGIACGVESMSRVQVGANVPRGKRDYQTDDYPWDDPPHLQFGGAERIARRQGHTRADLDAYGLRSQQRAMAATAAGTFRPEIVEIPTGTGTLDRDEGVRESTAAGLAALAPTVRDGLHTAGTTSQVSDGAAAVLWTSRRRAAELGLRPRGRLVQHVLTGSDPYFLLDGPLVATRKALAMAGMSVRDMDVVEVNEAFASVVLSWADHTGADLDTVNVNGGAIALGHPMGASGARLLATALGEIERRGGEHALVAMCCGGALGTASILQRL